MPCSRAPTPAPAMFAAEQRTLFAQTAVRKVPAAQPAAAKFYAPFVEPTTRPVALIAYAAAALAVRGPLFKAHSSFLI